RATHVPAMLRRSKRPKARRSRRGCTLGSAFLPGRYCVGTRSYRVNRSARVTPPSGTRERSACVPRVFSGPSVREYRLRLASARDLRNERVDIPSSRRHRAAQESDAMATTAADIMIEGLQEWGVEVVFGLPGDGINGIMEALRKRRDQVRFIQVRHEEAAALMACGYAKFTGRLGVCLATSGPGGIHLLNGLYDAALDGQPVVAITGMAVHDLIGTHTQQDVALDRLFADVAKFNQRIMGPSHVENVTHLACRTALAYRGVAHLTVPVDIQEMDAGAYRSKRNVKHHTSDV